MGINKPGTEERAEAKSTKREIADLIEIYHLGFLQLDPKRLASIWDQQHIPLIYVAMEKSGPIQGWPAIEQYYKKLPEHLEEMVAKKIDSIRIDPLGDTAVAFFKFPSTVRLKGHKGLYRPGGRVTMVFRRTPEGWRVIHYHESSAAARPAG
jgi:ketosteroid isomerase-like protein